MTLKLPLQEYEAFLLIENIKKNFPKQIEELNDIQIWPIFKQSLWTYLTHTPGKKKKIIKKKIN